MNQNETTIEAMLQAKGKTAPRLSPADITANIAHTEIHKHITHSGQVLRWAILTTLSGFAVVGKPSASVSAENDDQEVGEKVAIENSRDELWPLMGYALKQRLFDTRNTPPAPHSDLPPHQQRVLDERADLAEKLGKLEAFVDTPLFAGLDEAERRRLMAQHGAMFAYASILGERIAAFPAVDHQAI